MSTVLKRFILPVIVILWVFPGSVSAQNDDLYTFDAGDFSKKTWEWQGELKTTITSRSLNSDSVLYPIKFTSDEPDQAIDLNFQLSFESRWDWDWSRLFVSVEGNIQRSDLDDADDESSMLREGYWQFSGLDPHSIEIGKRLLRWGKGYAFNPVAFLERSKNPEDPEASREGLWVFQGVWIPGEVLFFDNSSLSLVYLPIRDDFNDDYAASVIEGDEWGLKLYVLAGTTDMDLYLVKRHDSTEMDWGFDFASNITSNFEAHGEYARIISEGSEEQKILVGTRYLTENDITWILEGYHDSSGLTKEDSQALLESVRAGSITAAGKLMSISRQGKMLNRNYAYIKASIKEPFNWLYVTPSTAWLINMDDSSINTTIQLTYTPVNNWDYQTSWQHMAGGSVTQFGENIVQDRIVMEMAYSF